MSDERKPPPAGRGGRGVILQALKEMSKTQPGGGGVSQPPISGGRGSLLTASSESESGSQRAEGATGISRASSSGYYSPHSEMRTASSGSTPSVGRGMNLANFLKQTEMPRGRGVGRAAPHSMSSESGSRSGPRSVAESLARLQVTSSEDEAQIVPHQKGSRGTPFKGMCNWIRLAVDPAREVYEYEVKFIPLVEAQNVRFGIIRQLSDQIGRVRSFDGAKLWLPYHMEQKETSFSAQVPHTGEEVTVVIVFQRKASMERNLQHYNVLFNHVMKQLKLVLIGRNYYSQLGSVPVEQHKLEVWPGYVTAIHQMDGGLMLCVDVSHRVLRTNTVYSVMNDLFHRHRGNTREVALQELVGTVVITRYNNRTYRIDDINFDANPMSTFTTSKNEQLTYLEYFKRTHNLTIVDKSQPLLISKRKKREQRDEGEAFICLIPELCFTTGLTDDMRSDYRVMKDISMHTRLTPNSRQTGLKQFIKNVRENSAASQILNDWGLTLMEDTVELDGRRLTPNENIFFGGDKSCPVNAEADWGRDSCREQVLHPVHMPSGRWAVVYLARNQETVMKSIMTYKQVTQQMGIDVGDPELVQLTRDDINSYVTSINMLAKKRMMITIVIFPTRRDDKYNAVKRAATGELGMPTQVIIHKTISQDNKHRSVIQKIALQINCKLGGDLWRLNIPLDRMMVIGVDVYHDPVTKGRSVVGFVASQNKDLTQWFSYANFQSPGEEVISSLQIALMQALKEYIKENGEENRPEHIVIYRDGVSDGMMGLTHEHEVPQLVSVFTNYHENYNPAVYFIVVQKRINTRIFAKTGMRDDLANPQPGSVIDDVITKKKFYDFLLVSQFVRQGTVSPTHYVVLRDGGGKLTVDRLQRLTYKLTHLYYNWPGTIRVPAPCQYAHKLAYLVGQNVRKTPHPNLRRRLHFL